MSGELWSQLRAEHSTSGLWPLLLEESVQPWSVGQIAPDDADRINLFHAQAFMDEVWADWVESASTTRSATWSPSGRSLPVWPNLGCPWRTPMWSPTGTRGSSPATAPRSGSSRPRAAPTRWRSWDGRAPSNHNEWAVPMAAVIRSWEDRFGARVVGVGFNTLDLSVAAPPTTELHAVHVAAEHWTFCPDSIVQGPGTLEDYAEQIRGRNAWSFWWD